ncbi:MAG: MtaA/CmuA family methyltransferase [Chloroflexi bacterium]|nr:MtaA/CmuA family methyltransferase [Chloroflexota bacterium]|tara:strand:- start:195 stop:1232 length:1038 start_codon:yes stop_codon:yes gene_type:complete
MIDTSLNMNSKQRVLNALNGKNVDRPPVSNPTSVATVELMDYVDAPFPDACRDANLNAKLAITGYTELGFDSIAPYFSIIQESSALGCEMQWEQKDNWPTVRMGNPIWKSKNDIKIPSGFLEHRDNIAITKSINILKEEVKDEVAIFGKTMGPWTLAYHVFGVEPFLLNSIDDPQDTKDMLRKLMDITILFGQAQIDAGADALVIPDHATGDLVSGKYYDDFLLNLHQELVEELKVPLILHICGRTVDRMPSIAKSGMAAFHFDSKNSPKEAMEAVGDGIRLVGNVNNPETLYSKTPNEVKSEVYEALDAGVQLISTECAIPLKTKIENLIAIPESVKSWVKENI